MDAPDIGYQIEAGVDLPLDLNLVQIHLEADVHQAIVPGVVLPRWYCLQLEQTIFLKLREIVDVDVQILRFKCSFCHLHRHCSMNMSAHIDPLCTTFKND